MANPPTNSTRSRRSSKGRSAGTHATETTLPPASIELAPAAQQLAPELAPERVAAAFVARSGGFSEAPNRQAMIAEAAYFRAAARGFAPGHEQEDWLAAELEVDAVLARVADGALSLRTMGDAQRRGPPN